MITYSKESLKWVYKDFLKAAQTKATDDQHASKTEDP